MTILLETFEVLRSFYAADCQLLSSLNPHQTLNRVQSMTRTVCSEIVFRLEHF
jgi:hypothetical protein